MLDSRIIARYFLSKDKNHNLFNKVLISKNGRKFYEGNARLNKYLHLSQNVYIAMTGNALIDSSFYAYDNGAVLPEIQENYSILISSNYCDEFDEISSDIKSFLNKMYIALKNATLDELIELSHEDIEWKSKKSFYDKQSQKMDSLKNKEIYKEQYQDFIDVLNRIMV